MAVFYKGFGFRDLPSLPAKRPAEFSDEHEIAQRFRAYGEGGRAEIIQPFRGITTDGRVVPGLFPLRSAGAGASSSTSTAPIRQAARAFLDSLEATQRGQATFAVDDPLWRAWSNIHPFILRHGVVLDDCTPTQRERALDVIRATCSARGFELARDVMRLNDALGEITGRPTEYGEWFYWLSIFGEPSPDEPWGWQIDGHHLIVNCFVLGEQLVMTPSFFGSEPTAVETGKHAGTRAFEDEEQLGLAFVQGLNSAQRAKAIPSSMEGVLRAQRMDGRIQTPAFRDNIDLPYAGVPAEHFSGEQRSRFLDLIEVYTGRTREEHARVTLEQIEQHLDQTRFLWVGGLENDSVFYYRIHSPVVLIEFDHLPGIAFDNDEPSRNHIHTVVRTPNGNDYGKDLLRQHWATHHSGKALSAR